MKFLLLIIISLAYILSCTLIFEYTVNEASNTWLTLSGVTVFIVFTYFYFRYLLKNLKKLNS